MALPTEIINKIFTEDDIKIKELLQLQLTCRHWSPIAQKILYTFIDFEDEDDRDEEYTREEALQKAKLLIRTLVLPNNQSRFWIKAIHFGRMLDFQFESIAQDPHSNISLLAHLCPNIRQISADPTTFDFYQLLTQLHCEGYLQHLNDINRPEFTDSFDGALWISYDNMLREFKHCIKEIQILNTHNLGFPDFMAKAHPITLDSLHDFEALESLHVVEFARMKLHQLQEYICKCVSRVRSIEIHMEDGSSIETLGYVKMSVAQPHQQVMQLDLGLHGPITHDDMLCMMLHYPSLFSLQFAIRNGSLGDASVPADIAIIYQFVEYLFTIPLVNFNDIHLNTGDISQLTSFVAKSIQVKKLRFSVLEPTDEDQALISLAHILKYPKATADSKNELIKTSSCIFEVKLLSWRPQQMLLSHALNVFKARDVEKLILGPSYQEDTTLPIQITHDMIDAILDNYGMLKNLTFTLVEFPEDTPATLVPGRRKYLDTLALQNCVITSGYLAELSRRLEHVNKFKYLDIGIDEYYLNSENAKISVHMPHTTFNTIRLEFPAIGPYLIKITTVNACVRIKTSHEQGLVALSAQEYTQLENAKEAYQVDVVCHAVNTISTIYGLFNV